MPPLPFPAAVSQAAPAAAPSDLKWVLADNEVDGAVQAALYHRGFTKIAIFLGLGETRVEVRDALAAPRGRSRRRS